MKIKKFLLSAAAVAMLVSPAHAQLGGLKPKLPGSGNSESSASVNAADIDAYIARAQENTILLHISYQLLRQAKDGKVDLAALEAAEKDLKGTPDPKELNAKLSALTKGEDKSGELSEQDAADLEAKIASQSPEIRAQIGNALINLAIAIPRAIDLSKEAPDLIKGLGSNPAALRNIGKIKDAAKLTADQISGTAKIVPMLPSLMTAAKVKPVKDAKTEKPRPIGKAFQ